MVQVTSISIRTNRLGISIQQVRHLKRKPAYPQTYKPQLAPLTHSKKDHSSFFQRHLKEWLGPKNVRGEYYRNKYYYPPQNHTPKYIVPDGSTVIDSAKPLERDERRYNDSKRNPSLQPFPQNPHCKTASILSDELKQKIYKDVTENGLHTQEVAHKYGIKVPRIEAVVKLQAIEKQWKEESKLTDDLDKFSGVMYRMFPLYQPPVEAENLTEIPTPQRTLHQRFLTISESEPFGPVDAAKLFDLEPAQQTLNNLTEFKEEAESTRVKLNKVIIGTERQDERTAFKFIESKSGSVGFRYGASRRDRKKDRAIGFDNEGKMLYI